ncbi:TIGR04211 family SH3 domain-containing protein [Pseudomonas guariconensis]|uniref:TIGR04211 family SH3 domain-containing protein n=1 Tax=Pseudomonas TaxID=286 RepID=UPI001CE46FD9|nr:MULTISPECIES: TIGR04211 family SH3 domain-containing protein [Pseudomonas]MCO7517571.1 TIGR04211 family SH3 domain-containing protein [Pseudomonas putida]MCO7608027.1 TIGR04211 family SH3 domain-containing protein [Pseudomonas guariconensis]MCO7634858.1 TIGR04211 family SH3 domain-containing protein [Pseudomonas guariconensis]
MPDLRPASSALPALRGSLIAALIALAAPVHAEEPASDARWVSDTLSTYVRSGPTNGHRIVGTLKAGQKVTLIGTQGSYSQVRGQNGDLVWILTSDLQTVPGQAERLPQLDAQVAQLSEQLKTIDDSWKNRVQGMQETLDSRKALIDELEARNKALNEQLDQAQSSLRDTQARLGDENKQVMMRYMVYGGSIAGAGLLAGLILPALTRGRRRNDRWF